MTWENIFINLPIWDKCFKHVCLMYYQSWLLYYTFTNQRPPLNIYNISILWFHYSFVGVHFCTLAED